MKHKTDIHILVVKTTDGQKLEVEQCERVSIPSCLNMATAKLFILWHELKKLVDFGKDETTKGDE